MAFMLTYIGFRLGFVDRFDFSSLVINMAGVALMVFFAFLLNLYMTKKNKIL